MPVERVRALPALASRPEDSHKGMFGHVLVVGGSRGMAGAPSLAGASALRSGAGLVRVAAPAEVQPTVAGFEPSYMTWPLAGDADGGLADAANRPALERLAGAATVLAVGPGLGGGAEAGSLVRWILAASDRPVVLDADGLNAVVDRLDLLRARRAPLVITPHPGEAARLLGTTTAAIGADREAAALDLAGRTGVVVVLKGSASIVTDGRALYVNPTGNPGMATGGSGDVLTGVIAALLGQGLSPFAAAQLGTYVHGLAGDLARDDHGVVGLIAGDLVDALPDAFRVFEDGRTTR
jgi:NAD(P)H-hydrate epimerase